MLAAARASLAPGGFMVVMDEAVAEDFAPHGDELERVMYGFSLLVCLPDGMSAPGSVGTGTVMRPATLRRYAQEAGFTGFEVLPIEEFGFWRFYLLSVTRSLLMVTTSGPGRPDSRYGVGSGQARRAVVARGRPVRSSWSAMSVHSPVRPSACGRL